uniref:hypothetical protein n=1 Tax=Legionella sp. TaxID=459 RepID=UPI0032205C77
PLFEIITNKLNDKEMIVRQAASTCLTTMALTLEKETLTTFVEFIKNNLNSQQWTKRDTALKGLATIAPALEKETLISLVESVKNTLNDLNSPVFEAALNCLTSIASVLGAKTLATLVAPVTDKLNDEKQYENARRAACHFLVFLLANPENSLVIETDSASLNTSESLFIHIIYKWVSQIHTVSIQAEVAMQSEKDLQMNRF